MSENLIAINQDRLWGMLMRSAEIGAFNGGLRRIAFTREDKEMRDQFCQWGREADFKVSVDAIGNIFIRREGKNPELPPIAMGSHLDTTVHGGRFDGILGVLAGLEVLLSLEDAGIETERAVEAICWSDEEGTRYNNSMLGSYVYLGKRDLEEVYALKDVDGITVKEALEEIGYIGDAPMNRPFHTFLELHIEQGPIMYDTNTNIGVVTGSYDVRGMRIRFKGETCHVGPTPMERRKNALAAAAYMIAATNDIGLKWMHESAKTTCSKINVYPNKYAIVANQVEIGIDYRHPECSDRMHEELLAALEEAARKANCEYEIYDAYLFGQDKFCADLVQEMRELAPRFSDRVTELLGQAGHDAYNFAARCPTAMIFTPCVNGYTHNEREDIVPEETWPGVNLLLNIVRNRACR